MNYWCFLYMFFVEVYIKQSIRKIQTNGLSPEIYYWNKELFCLVMLYKI